VSDEPMTRGRLILSTAAVMTGLLLAALDQTIVGTALPRIVAELRGLEHYAWVVTAYMVASTTTVPIAGKLGDLFGRKPLLVFGMSGFVLASALCGQAQDMLQLVAFRAFQGLFGGVLFATVFASVADLYPPRERPKVQGLFGGIWGIASVIGPTAGGFLTDTVGWRWVFYVNLPIGIAAVAFVVLTMPWRRGGSRHDIDYAGAMLLAAGLVPLLVALSITRDHAWTSPEMLALLAMAAAGLGAFYVVERRAREPIVPFSLFRHPTFTVSTLTGFLLAFGMFGAIVYVPLVYQGVLGIPATNAGLLMTPLMVGLVVSSILTGQLMIRIRRYRYIGTVGIALAAIALYSLGRVTPGTSEFGVVRDLVILGVGLGATMPLYINVVQSALPVSLTGVVTSQVQFWRNVGGTVGVAVMGSILATRLPERVDSELAALPLPPAVRDTLPQAGADPQALFDPARIAAARAALPSGLEDTFDQVLLAIRQALAGTLNEVYTYAAFVVAAGILASVFLREVPLRGRAEPGESERQRVAAFGD
jgi:EmrB/QacA subfamily drug resistance transporter